MNISIRNSDGHLTKWLTECSECIFPCMLDETLIEELAITGLCDTGTYRGFHLHLKIIVVSMNEEQKSAWEKWAKE